MPLKAAIWVHGNVAEVELRKRLRSISEVEEFGKPIGWGKYFESDENKTNWFHFPMPTPVILDDIRPQLIKVFVFYKTSAWVDVTNIHIYDGARRIKTFDGLALSGDHSAGIDASNAWVIDPPVTINYGLGISMGVRFGNRDGSVYPGILFTSAGADFKRP